MSQSGLTVPASAGSLARTLASTKTPFATIYLLRVALLLCQSNTEMLRHDSKVRVPFALRAEAHSAKSVCRFAARSAAKRASLDSLPFGEEEDRTSQVRAPGGQGPVGVSVIGCRAFSSYKHWSVATARTSVGVQSKHMSVKPKTKEHLLQLHGFRSGQRRVELAKFVAPAECWLTHRSTGPVAACG